MQGVFAVYTAHDLDDLVEPVRAPSRMQNYHATEMFSLARDKVRYVGEPVVAVLGENRYLAGTRSLGSRSPTICSKP